MNPPRVSDEEVRRIIDGVHALLADDQVLVGFERRVEELSADLLDLRAAHEELREAAREMFRQRDHFMTRSAVSSDRYDDALEALRRALGVSE